MAGETILPSWNSASNGEQTYSWSAGGTVVAVRGGQNGCSTGCSRTHAERANVVTRQECATKDHLSKAQAPAATDDRLVIDLVLEDAKALQKHLVKPINA
jgi:hypothetical protein